MIVFIVTSNERAEGNDDVLHHIISSIHSFYLFLIFYYYFKLTLERHDPASYQCFALGVQRHQNGLGTGRDSKECHHLGVVGGGSREHYGPSPSPPALLSGHLHDGRPPPQSPWHKHVVLSDRPHLHSGPVAP